MVRCVPGSTPLNAIDGRRAYAPRFWFAIAILASVLLLGTTAPWAQGSGSEAPRPRTLKPRTLQPPPKPAESPGGAVTDKSPKAGEESVRIDTLETIAAESVGILGEAEGGFGSAMWAGTPRSVVGAVLSELPVRTASAAMRDLARRLLLSAATAPEGSSSTNLLALRASLLADMGDLQGVGDLLAAVAGRFEDPRLDRVESESRLLANDHARACSLAADAADAAAGIDDYWPKLVAFCQVLAGEADRAALSVSLLRETGVTDRNYFTLMDVLLGTAAKPPESLANAGILHLAMASWAKVTVSADALAANGPAVLNHFAGNKVLSMELRLEAAERAEIAGVLSTDALRHLYDRIAFPDDALSNPLTWAESEGGPAGRALLYRTAVEEALPAARAEAVAHAHRLGRESGRYGSAVRTFLPVLKTIPADPVVAWFAPEAARALLIGGAPERAIDWLALMRTLRRSGPNEADPVVALEPILRLTGAAEATGVTPADLETWWRQAQAREGAARQAVVLFTLLSALGESVPETLWVETLRYQGRSLAPLPSSAVWHRLEVAATEGRIGETVLLALIAMGEEGPAEASPIVTGRVIENLMRIGLEADARRFAIEAAVAAGL